MHADLSSEIPKHFFHRRCTYVTPRCPYYPPVQHCTAHTGRHIETWEVVLGQEEACGPAITIPRLGVGGFCPSLPRWLETCLDDTVRLWDGRTGAPIATLEGHSGGVACVTFSPDGSRLTLASRLRHTLHRWNGTTGARITAIEHHSGPVHAVAISPRGLRLASALDCRVFM